MGVRTGINKESIRLEDWHFFSIDDVARILFANLQAIISDVFWQVGIIENAINQEEALDVTLAFF